MSLIPKVATVTIANGASLSSAINFGDGVLCAIKLPAAWTAAGLTFQVSDDGGATWDELLDNASVAVTVAAPAAGTRINMYATDFQSSIMLKVRSGTVAVPVAQGAARVLTLIARKFYSGA